MDDEKETAVVAVAVGTFCLFVCPHDKSKMVEAPFGTRDILWHGTLAWIEKLGCDVRSSLKSAANFDNTQRSIAYRPLI